MKLFKNIRFKIGSTILKGKAVKNSRKVVYKNFNLVKNIGIVWNASNVNEFQTLSKFHKQMHERNIDVNIIGYYEEENLPDSYTAVQYFSCIRSSEVNWFFIPESDDTQNFIDKKFDVLIDLNFDKIFTLNYITILSNALFKVGLFEADNQNNPFDLMMEIKKPVSAENYLEQIIQYLELINS